MFNLFNRLEFDNACSKAVQLFETSAPTVSDWAEKMYGAKDWDITLAEIHLLSRINTLDPNTAANQLYKLMVLLGRDTRGQAGY